MNSFRLFNPEVALNCTSKSLSDNGLEDLALPSKSFSIISSVRETCLMVLQTLRHASCRLQPFKAPHSHSPFLRSLLQVRFLSSETRAAIEKAVRSSPVVLFMKGTPELPQCGFSRASIQVLSLQGLDPNKFAAFNVLEDPELRQGTLAFEM